MSLLKRWRKRLAWPDLNAGIYYALTMEISKKVYIKGEESLTRLKNLEKLAEEHFRGNFSEMVNDALNKIYHLDPATGQSLKLKAKT